MPHKNSSVSLGFNNNANIPVLHRAVLAEDKPKCLELLSSGIDINTGDKERQTPLHLAAAAGLADMCEFLIEQGAQVDALNRMHKTPLHTAAEKGGLDCCKVLVNAGADITVDCWASSWLPIHYAARSGNAEVCKYLIEKNSPVNPANENGVTPLILASGFGHRSVCKAFLDAGSKSEGALISACMQGQAGVCEDLIAYGVEVDECDETGETALLYAVKYGHSAICRLLLSAGANPRKQNQEGLCALDFVGIEDADPALKAVFDTYLLAEIVKDDFDEQEGEVKLSL